MIIDFRVRPPYAGNLSLGIFGSCWNAPEDPTEEMFTTAGRRPIPSAEQRSVPLLLEELREADVKAAVLMGRVSEIGTSHTSTTNDDALMLSREHPGAFFPFAAVEPRDPHVMEELELRRSQGFTGVCIDPSFSTPPLYADDPVIDRVYQYCQDYGMIVSIMQSGLYVKDLTYTHPIHVQHVAQTFPRLKIVVPHACWPYLELMTGVAMMHTNIWLIPDCYVYLPGMFGAENFVHTVNTFLRHRVLFASSYPVRGIAQSIELWKALPFTTEALQLTMYDNAARLLNL